MIKKFFLTLINIISVMIIAAAVVVLCLVVFTKQGEAPNLGGYTVFRIRSRSEMLFPFIPQTRRWMVL